tara:strand:+ start:1973 stop:2845 length:873 start_codon:yes stop_codon:yes gene_type:complete
MDDKIINMTYTEGRTLYRSQLKILFNVNEVDFYYKAILKSSFNIEPTALALDPETLFSQAEQEFVYVALQRLLKEEPLQYILGTISFRSIELQVTPAVLIPRPETEELVAWILEDHKLIAHKQKVIDFGTGSGCVAISLAIEQPFFEVTALDIISEAIDLAKSNAQKNKAVVNFIQGDITSLNTLNFPINIIVSNPPYIPPSEKKEMKNNVLNNEPHLALFVPEDDPLLFYKCILEYAQKSLLPKGFVYFEINPYFLSEMKNLILSTTNYSIKERKDIFGKVRMLRLQSH